MKVTLSNNISKQPAIKADTIAKAIQITCEKYPDLIDVKVIRELNRVLDDWGYED
jgi:hypothetical protein